MGKRVLRKAARQPKTAGPHWLRWLLFTVGALCMGTAVAVAVQWIVTGSLSTVWEWFLKYPTYLPLSALLYGAAVYVLGALTGRLWVAGTIVSIFGLFIALVDYFKTAINGTPLVLADAGMFFQLGQVAGVAGELRPPVDFWFALAGLGICVVLLALLGRFVRLTGRVRLVSAVVSAAVAVFLFTPLGAKGVGAAFSVDVYTRMTAANNHDTYGLTLSLWRDGSLQDMQGPEGYSQAYMEQVLSRIDELLAEQAEPAAQTSPNVIFVLSESFYDLTKLPDLTYERDPLKNFHALEAEGISGSFHSHYLGYGTGYLEMCMLYGITSLDFGTGTNLCFLKEENYDWFDSLAEQYTNRGYQARMLHAYNDSLYNRTVTYPLMGFSKLLFSQDVQNLGLPWQGSVYGGYYMKDAYLFRGLVEQMEEINDAGDRAFCTPSPWRTTSPLTRRNLTTNARSAWRATPSATRIWPSSGSCWRGSPGRTRPWESWWRPCRRRRNPPFWCSLETTGPISS